MAVEDTDLWLALCTIGPVMFLALGALAVELVRERGLGWKRPAQKVQLIAINVSFLGTLLATVTSVLSIRATLSRQSRRGRSFHAWLGPSGIRGTSVEPVGTRTVWQARFTGRCRPSGDIWLARPRSTVSLVLSFLERTTRPPRGCSGPAARRGSRSFHRRTPFPPSRTRRVFR